jgi:hypothetical protein
VLPIARTPLSAARRSLACSALSVSLRARQRRSWICSSPASTLYDERRPILRFRSASQCFDIPLRQPAPGQLRRGPSAGKPYRRRNPKSVRYCFAPDGREGVRHFTNATMPEPHSASKTLPTDYETPYPRVGIGLCATCWISASAGVAVPAPAQTPCRMPGCILNT